MNIEREENENITLTWENVTVTACPPETTFFKTICCKVTTKSQENTVEILKEGSYNKVNAIRL